MRRFVLGCILILLFFGLARAEAIHAPEYFESIQDAVESGRRMYASAPVCVESGFSLRPEDCQRLGVFPDSFDSTNAFTRTFFTQSSISFQVCNICGQPVDVLLDRVMAAGRHSLVWKAEDFSAGVYLVRMENEYGNAPEKLQKIILVK